MTLSRSLILLACLAPATCSASEPAVAFVNATIETMTDKGRIENGVLVIRGKNIEAVGKDVRPPVDARIVDASGKTLMPGLVDIYRVISIQSGGAASQPRTVVINGRTFTVPNRTSTSTGSFTRIADNFYPYDLGAERLVRRGVTTINLVTSGQGQAAIARVTPNKLESMLFQPEGMLFAALTNQTTSLDILRRPLDGGTRGSPRSSSTAGRPTSTTAGRPASTTAGRPTSTSAASSATKKLWSEVAAGTKPILLNVNNSATVLHLERILKKHSKVKPVVIMGGGQLYESIETVKQSKLRLVLAPTVSTIPYSQNRFCPARLAAESGIEFALSPSLESTTTSDDPLLSVAFLVKHGVSRKTALEALTIQPARFLGIDKTLGSLESKKLATFLVFDGDPLDRSSSLEQCWVEGEDVNKP